MSAYLTDIVDESLESTYKELKLISEFTDAICSSSLESTYKELKPSLNHEPRESIIV